MQDWKHIVLVDRFRYTIGLAKRPQNKNQQQKPANELSPVL